MPKNRAAAGLALRLKDLGIPSYVHTVNKRAEFERFKELGVGEIYTDILHPGRNPPAPSAARQD